MKEKKYSTECAESVASRKEPNLGSVKVEVKPIPQILNTNECLEANGGCWQDKKSNVTACKDTFRGRVCKCPVVNGVRMFIKEMAILHVSNSEASGGRRPPGFKGDGLKCEERSGSRIGWFFTFVILPAVAGICVAGYVFYKYRLRSYMDSEIMTIMSQYMPLDSQNTNDPMTGEPQQQQLRLTSAAYTRTDTTDITAVQRTATKSAQHACRKRGDHSEYESLSRVEIGLFVIRPNQEQLVYDLLIRFQHAQTARSETSNTRTRRRSSFIQKEESPRTAAHHQPSSRLHEHHAFRNTGWQEATPSLDHQNLQKRRDTVYLVNQEAKKVLG
ncbi:hypothetical protein YC2023_099536 [Brassica napus]